MMRLFASAWVFILLSTIAACQQMKTTENRSRNIDVSKGSRKAYVSEGSNIINNTNISFIKRVELANAAFIKDANAKYLNGYKTIELLKNKDYAAVDNIYEKLLDEYVDDVDREQPLFNAYSMVIEENGFDIKWLDDWVSTTGSYAAYAARGAYKKDKGFSERGGKYIKDTPEDKIERMKKLFVEAESDFLIAIEKKPTLMPAYDGLIGMARASKMSFTPREILEMAEKVDKKSFVVRNSYMYSLTPRWGGSYDEMKAFARYVVQFSDMNPRFWRLQGNPYAEMGYSAYLEDDYQRAAEFYSQALVFGDCANWLMDQARSYHFSGKANEATETFRKILSYEPNNEIAKVYSEKDKSKYMRVHVSEESSTFDDINKYAIKKYAVILANHSSSWLKKYPDYAEETLERNVNKLHRTLSSLGFGWVERKTVVNAMDDLNINVRKLSPESITKLGKTIGADAFIFLYLPEMASGQKEYSEHLSIQAVSVDAEKSIWGFYLKGSAKFDVKIGHMNLIFSDIENNAYEIVRSKLEKQGHKLL